jgi:hypothetical protein
VYASTTPRVERESASQKYGSASRRSYSPACSEKSASLTSSGCP